MVAGIDGIHQLIRYFCTSRTLNVNKNPAFRVAKSYINFAFCTLHLIVYRCDTSVAVLYSVILEGATRPKDLIP